VREILLCIFLLSVTLLTGSVLSVIIAKCHSVECHFTERLCTARHFELCLLLALLTGVKDNLKQSGILLSINNKLACFLHCKKTKYFEKDASFLEVILLFQ
jgi:hypothetical protein